MQVSDLINALAVLPKNCHVLVQSDVPFVTTYNFIEVTFCNKEPVDMCEDDFTHYLCDLDSNDYKRVTAVLIW